MTPTLSSFPLPTQSYWVWKEDSSVPEATTEQGGAILCREGHAESAWAVATLHVNRGALGG